MNSVIFRSATRYMFPILLLLSVFLLMSGHNEPGGGFTGGLVAASAFVLYALAFDTAEARRRLWLDPRHLIGAGLLLALASGMVGLLAGEPFLTAYWVNLPLPGGGSAALGTPLLFDAGVFLDVIGLSLLIIFSMADVDRGES